ncbi:MAG TPA: hypothetical protein VFS42_09285 [Burkholderiaceae bacterium]|nr:hypothetical protein [Burkholderiaceae bacterium]
MDGETLSNERRHERSRDIVASGSYIIDAAAARRAVQLALPLLEQAVRNQDLGQSGVLHVVVMDPALTPLNSTFEHAILYEHSVGTPRDQWDADYAEFARAKASVSWHTGLDSHAVRFAEPYRLRAGDTTLWGSVALDGIIVGVSGAEPAFDEAIAGTIAMFLRALAKTTARNFDKQPFLQ